MFENVLIDKKILGKESDIGEECFHIAFGITSNYSRPIGILCKSILANAKNTKMVFHIFSDGIIDDSELKRFKQLVEKYNTVVMIYYFDNKLFHGLDDREFTIATYYRFAIPNQLKTITDRVLYLDADMVAVGDLGKFKDIDISNKIVAAVREFKFDKNCKVIPYNKDDFYFNAGMMYINIPLWEEEKVSETCMSILREVFADESKKAKYGYAFQCFDQDALNIVLKGKTKFLEPKYNFLTNISLRSNKNLITVPEDTVIIHYHGFNKPWHEWCFHGLNKYYRKEALTSPWADVPWDNSPTKYRQMRLYAKYYLKKGDILNSINWLCKSIKKKNER